MLVFQASKAALVSFYESMRVELAPEISITIATLGFVDSEMTRGKHLNNEGNTEMNSELSNVSYLSCHKDLVAFLQTSEFFY